MPSGLLQMLPSLLSCSDYTCSSTVLVKSSFFFIPTNDHFLSLHLLPLVLGYYTLRHVSHVSGLRMEEALSEEISEGLRRIIENKAPYVDQQYLEGKL